VDLLDRMKQPLINNTIVWLAWERHRRTIELCRYLGITPIILESSLPRLFKHPYFFARTLGYILIRRPEILIVQNPSIVLTLLGCVLHRLLGFFFVVDAHNGGIIPDSTIGSNYFWIYRLWQKEADLTIVTNRFMAAIVVENGGKTFILPDKLPEYRSNCAEFDVKGRINILCVSTFDIDEPYREVFEAAKELPDDYLIYMTGNYDKIDSNLPGKCPKQIRLTGFLSEKDYWDLLNSVDFVIDLTFRENCLVCGAYEAVSQRKPLILSDTSMLKEYFARGALFTKNESKSISRTILIAANRLEELQLEVKEGGDVLGKEWAKMGEKLVQILRDKA